MDFFFSGLFWGGILVLLGLSVILKAVFNIHFPLFRVVFGLIVIYFGLRVLMGGVWTNSFSSRDKVLFNEATISATGKKADYTVLFGKGTIDFTTIPDSAVNSKMEVSTIFGQSKIKISSVTPTAVHVSSAFAGTRLPDGNFISFGEQTYRNKACENTVPKRVVEVNVVFGACEIVEIP